MNNSDKKQAEELARLVRQVDEAVDVSDAPEITDWSAAQRGRFYRPVKKQVTLRIDADVLGWFKAGGSKYQSRINAVLREYVKAHARQSR